MKKRHIVLIVLLSILIVGAAAVLLAYNSINESLKELEVMPIRDIDLTQIADGTYDGVWSTFPVAAEVRVTVKNHAITVIQLVKHDNGMGSAAEVLPEKVIEAQSLNVDIVSGATHSSKVILKAIENALEKGSK